MLLLFLAPDHLRGRPLRDNQTRRETTPPPTAFSSLPPTDSPEERGPTSHPRGCGNSLRSIQQAEILFEPKSRRQLEYGVQVLFRGFDWHEIEFFVQHVQHIRRDEGR